MTQITIPPEALEAGARALFDFVDAPGSRPWGKERAEARARAAFTAMLRAWPGISTKQATDHVMLLNSRPALILPLQESSDDRE